MNKSTVLLSSTLALFAFSTANAMPKHGHGKYHMMQKIEALQLDDATTAQVKSIFEANKPAHQQLRQENRVAMDANRDMLKEQLTSVLSSQQIEQLFQRKPNHQVGEKRQGMTQPM